ncbi:MAG: Sec-independent protein translocase protein TatB [Rhodospirillales bacterium]|nr:Sec-independent protein translocase protein TatB [Rhodospirillales bacterium]
MFDIGWPELFIIAVVVLLVVGPKDLPKVLRTVGHFAGKAKAITREFRSHVDDMIRESELEDVRDQINNASESSLEALTENVIHPDGLEDLECFEDDWRADGGVSGAANDRDQKNTGGAEMERSSPVAESDEIADDAKQERPAS